MYADTVFYTDCGGRPKNEDAVDAVRGTGSLIVLVADGLGGMGGGELASQDAAEYLRRQLARQPVDEDALCDAIVNENERICTMHSQGGSMMTTVAVLWMDGVHTAAATVGDTRIYQFREGRILFQSVDHSVAQMAVFSGEISPEQIRQYPARNRLLRALGADEQVLVDSCTLEVLPGDRFLLCSDGFWELITEEEMCATCTPGDTAEEWLQAMRRIVAARITDRSDNHTAAAVILRKEDRHES